MFSFRENRGFAFGDKATNRLTDKHMDQPIRPIVLSRSRCRERRLNKRSAATEIDEFPAQNDGHTAHLYSIRYSSWARKQGYSINGYLTASDTQSLESKHAHEFTTSSLPVACGVSSWLFCSIV